MPEIASLFVTRLYRARLSDHAPAIDAAELETSCMSIEIGRASCRERV